MSKIRTSEALIDHIAKDISWRKRELSELWLQISSLSDADLKQRIYIRCAIGSLYAHWEGFIKECSASFLEYVHNRHIKNHEVCTEIMALSIKRRLRKTLIEDDAGAYVKIIANIRNDVNSRFGINFNNAIEANDNLNSKVLKRISNYLNIDYSLFATREKQIDSILLHYRNNIVHGKNLWLNRATYRELHEDIIMLLETFRNCVENSVATKSYIL